jgi:hypothetical protein
LVVRRCVHKTCPLTHTRLRTVSLLRLPFYHTGQETAPRYSIPKTGMCTGVYSAV